MASLLIVAAACTWLGLLALPWRPWATRERLQARPGPPPDELSRVTAIIPARNEAACVAATLDGLSRQGPLAEIVLIDDQSDDGTGAIARRTGLANLRVVDGQAPPPGWSGKLWALEQGLAHADSEYLLLLDADIELAPGILAAAIEHLRTHDRDMVSLMAALHMESPWERLLLPPFIYFFKLIYPFALANDDRSRVAAAAGGFILIKSGMLRALGGFGALRGALIDDCELAQRVKRRGGRIWIGLTHDARAIRPYASLAVIWDMVARTAYTQLRYSPLLLLGCTLMLALMFIIPVTGLLAGAGTGRIAALAGCAAMCWSYWPTLRYYRRPGYWVLTLPFAAVLFLGMTWTSAWRYWRGERSRWKHRCYARDVGP